MGQKVNPVGLRIGINKGWQSRWFATRDYARLLKEDMQIRKIIEDQLGNAGISKIEMERTAEEVKVDMFTAKPGMVIGRRGATINDIRQSIEEATGNIIQLNIVEVKKPELVAILVAESIANQLLGRVSFRRAMKKAITLSLKAGAKGVKIQCSGRLGGAEMARREWYREGRVPLHTLRANIDYGFAEANTTFGKIGVKVWIYLGDIILDGTEDEKRAKAEPEARSRPRPKNARDDLRSRVKKGAKKIKEIRKSVIGFGLDDAEVAVKTEEKPEKNEEIKETPKTVEVKEIKKETENLSGEIEEKEKTDSIIEDKKDKKEKSKAKETASEGNEKEDSPEKAEDTSVEEKDTDKEEEK